MIHHNKCYHTIAHTYWYTNRRCCEARWLMMNLIVDFCSFSSTICFHECFFFIRLLATQTTDDWHTIKLKQYVEVEDENPAFVHPSLTKENHRLNGLQGCCPEKNPACTKTHPFRSAGYECCVARSRTCFCMLQLLDGKRRKQSRISCTRTHVDPE